MLLCSDSPGFSLCDLPPPRCTPPTHVYMNHGTHVFSEEVSVGAQLWVRLADELHHLLHRPGRGVAAAEPGDVPGAEVPVRPWGWQTELLLGVPGTAPQSFPLNPPLSSSPTAGQRHSKGHVPVVPQIPAAQVWHTEALFPLLRPDFSGRPSILNPCPPSQPPFPLFVPSSHSSLSIG